MQENNNHQHLAATEKDTIKNLYLSAGIITFSIVVLYPVFMTLAMILNIKLQS